MKRWTVGTLFALGALVGCAEGTVTTARFVDPQTQIAIEYKLVGAHVYLAEFHRTLRVTFARSSQEFPLEMDAGGFLLLNIYRLPEHRLLCYDGADYTLIDTDAETIERAEAAPTSSAEYLGCFDWPQGTTLQFIPVAARAERRPLPRSADAGT